MGRPFVVSLFVAVLCGLNALALITVADARTVTLAFGDGPGGASGPDPLRALAEGGLSARAERAAPAGEGLPAGVYRVADLPAEPGATGARARAADRDEPTRGGTVPQAIGEIAPGLYATAFDTQGCGYQLQRVMADRRVAVIGEDHLASGRLLVSLNGIEPDWFSSTAGCGRWYRWQPLAVPLSQAGNGDYWVGDLARGLWRVPDGCHWEKTVGFRGADVDDVVEFGAGPTPLVVDADTVGVRIRTCLHPLTLDVTADRAALGPTGMTTATSTTVPAERSLRRRSTTTTEAAPVPELAGQPQPGPEAATPTATVASPPTTAGLAGPIGTGTPPTIRRPG